MFRGRVDFIRALVTFEGTDVDGLETAFRESVNDYLELCEEHGAEPEQPFAGSFDVRTGTKLHRQAAIYAHQKGLSLDRVVVEALNQFLPAQS